MEGDEEEDRENVLDDVNNVHDVNIDSVDEDLDEMWRLVKLSLELPEPQTTTRVKIPKMLTNQRRGLKCKILIYFYYKTDHSL